MKGGESRAKKSATLERTIRMRPNRKNVSGGVEMEDEEYESDYEDSGRDESDEEDF